MEREGREGEGTVRKKKGNGEGERARDSILEEGTLRVEYLGKAR